MEVLIATAIASMLIVAILSAFIFSLKSFAGMSTYTQVRRGGRNAASFFARDMRAVNAVLNRTATNLTVNIPIAFNSTGGVISNKTVSYSLAGTVLYRFDSLTGKTVALVSNVNTVGFYLYDRAGFTTSQLDVTKGVQMDLWLARSAPGSTGPERILSASINLRNKP